MAAQNSGRLESRLRAGEFAIVCEMSPPRGASIAPLRRKAALVRDWVDAAVVTDGQGAQVRMAAWAGCLAVMSSGVEAVMLLQGRDRNRLAIQADLLGAAGAGIPNVLLQTGDHAAAGDQPEAAESFDLDSLSALEAAAGMKHSKTLLSGRQLSRAPAWFIGCVENASAGGGGRVRRLAAKVDAGAEFVLTQYVFDLARFHDWMRRLRDEGLDQRVFVLAGVGPVMSRGALAFIEKLPDVYVPDSVRRRLLGVPEDQMAAEGMALAVEILHAIREEPGVAGVYLLTSNNEAVVGELLTRADVRRASTS
jgi:methylenetetrahydrofolate reductase (NADPH)